MAFSPFQKRQVVHSWPQWRLTCAGSHSPLSVSLSAVTCNTLRRWQADQSTTFAPPHYFSASNPPDKSLPAGASPTPNLPLLDFLESRWLPSSTFYSGPLFSMADPCRDRSAPAPPWWPHTLNATRIGKVTLPFKVQRAARNQQK